MRYTKLSSEITAQWLEKLAGHIQYHERLLMFYHHRTDSKSSPISKTGCSLRKAPCNTDLKMELVYMILR